MCVCMCVCVGGGGGESEPVCVYVGLTVSKLVIVCMRQCLKSLSVTTVLFRVPLNA